MLACTCRSNIRRNLDLINASEPAKDVGLVLRNEGCANPTGCNRPAASGIPAFAVYREDYTEMGAAICRYLHGLGGPACLEPIAAKQRACGRITPKRQWPHACAPAKDEAWQPREAMVCARETGWVCPNG